jgi:hypothetical protein
VLRDLLDLLLGWSLEPGLAPKDRQLIYRVLGAFKPGWLAEPPLVLEVGSKLLTDLRHLLPPPPPRQPQQQQAQALPATAEEGGAAEAPGQEQQQSQPQQSQQELQKLLALLSCLVAIVRTVVSSQECQGLLADTVAFMVAAHERFAALAADAGAGRCEPATHDWTSAAASIASTLLALWEAAAAVVPAGSAAGQETDASSDAPPSDAVSPLPLLQRSWGLALQSLALPLLAADDAAGLLGSISRCLQALLTTQSSSPGWPLLVEQLSAGLFEATVQHRCVVNVAVARDQLPQAW